jgi:hypothetical protein
MIRLQLINLSTRGNQVRPLLSDWLVGICGCCNRKKLVSQIHASATLDLRLDLPILDTVKASCHVALSEPWRIQR